MRRMLHPFALLSLAGLAFLLAGCSGGRGERVAETHATLEGTVSFGNEKILVAMIVVKGNEGQASGFIDSDGHYKIDNVPVGEVSIGVNTEAGKGNLQSQRMSRAQGGDKTPLPKVIDIPQKFFDPSSSGIKTTIQKGDNTYDIKVPR